MKRAYFYDNNAIVRAMRFTGDNADEIMAFGNQPEGSRPKVWRQSWPGKDKGEPEAALSYVVHNGTFEFAALRSGEWLVINQDGTMRACPHNDFGRRYSAVALESKTA